jgi:hypothetical protein
LRLPEHANASTHGRRQQLFFTFLIESEGDMRKRGKVLRDPHAGPGLLMIEGRQYPFRLDSVWKSAGSPRLGLLVDVDFGQSGQIVAITAVPDSELEKARTEAGGQNGVWRLLDRLAAKCGMTRIIEPVSKGSRRQV